MMGVWIDTDMGFDDLWAILVVRAAGIPVDGLSLVAGNSGLAMVERNAAGAAELFDWRMPIHPGADRALLGRRETAERALGEEGMRSRGERLPADAPRAAADPAFLALSRWLEAGESRRLLALGPITNVATVALARPDLVPRLSEVIWMGGSLGAGNHTASAEFNALADPEALAVALARIPRLTMVDLEACRRVRIAEADVPTPPAGAGRRERILADLAGGYLDIALDSGRRSMAVYDPVAAAALVAPEWFMIGDAAVRVDVSDGPERGRTAADPRPADRANARFVRTLDSVRVKRLCLEAMELER